MLGASPAGYAAAHWLVGKRLSVILIDQPDQASESPIAEWVPRGFFQESGMGRSLAKASGAAEFRRVCYHSVDLRKHIEHKSRSVLGYFVGSDKLRSAMRTAGEKAKVKFRKARHFPTIHLDEEDIHLFKSNPVQARLLIIAQGQPADVLNSLALPVRMVSEGGLVAAGLDIPISSGQALKKLSGAMHVVECPQRSEIGMFFVAGSIVHIRVISTSSASGTRVEELSGLVSSLPTSSQRSFIASSFSNTVY